MSRKVLLAAVVGVAVVGALVGVAWAVDRTRGIELGGRTVGDRPSTVLDAILRGYGTTPVVVHTPGGDLRTTADALGVSVDRAATLRAVADARSGGPVSWLHGLLHARTAPLIVHVDADKAGALVRAKDPTKRTNPVEPSIRGSRDGIVVEPGSPGTGLGTAAVVDAVRETARSGGHTIEAEVADGPLIPRFSIDDAEALAAKARSLTADALEVRAGAADATIRTATLRSWVRSTDGLQLTLDAKTVLGDLAAVLKEATTPTEDATVRIEGGAPVVVPGKAGVRCCAEGAPALVLDALLDRPTTAVLLPLRTIEPSRTTDEALALKIVEQIGSFTTRYPAGQPRVTNIHRIAELVDGVIIEPGRRFSVNDFVGKRTTEKGFVNGGTIQDGSFTETVGGGISQFATTLYNAAFFAGLDMPVYQSHSIYISRYPFGREATLSYPKPDLVIADTTPYGVLVDTSFTGTSVTITLWSTKYASGEQTAQTQTPVGMCTRVKTERTRQYVDGHTKVDNVFATYRPAEGVQC